MIVELGIVFVLSRTYLHACKDFLVIFFLNIIKKIYHFVILFDTDIIECVKILQYKL